MDTSFKEEHLPFGGRENAADAFIRTQQQMRTARSKKLNKEIDDLESNIEQTRLEYGEIAVAQNVTVVLESDGLPYPVPITELKFKKGLYLSGELVLYSASIALLAGQLFTTLDLDWRIIVAIIGLVFLLMTLVLPLFLWDFFKVSRKDPESKEPIEKIFFISLLIGIVAFIAFSLTRASSETEGLQVLIYGGSLPVTELMAATAAACCSVLRKWVAWSGELSRRFRMLDKQVNKLRNELSSLNKN